MIGKAKEEDIGKVAQIYEKILDLEEKNISTGWIRGTYPTEDTAKGAFERGELFVYKREDRVLAGAIINQRQDSFYKEGQWAFGNEEEGVMVLHTLVVDPALRGRGLAREMVAFYEEFAKENSCALLRMDTNKINRTARSLYKSLGYREAGVVACDFNGIQGVELVLLEKKVGN